MPKKRRRLLRPPDEGEEVGGRQCGQLPCVAIGLSGTRGVVRGGILHFVPKKIEDCNNDPQELSSYSIGWSLTAASFCPSHGVLVTVGDSSCPLAGRRGLVGRASS